MSNPNYKKIYYDLEVNQFPEKMLLCQSFFKKEHLSSLDIISINNILFKKSKASSRFRSYDKNTIDKVLEYYKNNKTTIIDTANHFNISRNTLAKWKKYKQSKNEL